MHSEIGQKSENGWWCDGATVCFPAKFLSKFIIQIVNFKKRHIILGALAVFHFRFLVLVLQAGHKVQFNIVLPVTVSHIIQCNR